MHTTLKIASLAALTLAFSAGTAFAGEGKDCDHKKAAMKTQASTAQQTSVLGAKTVKADKKMAKKVLSFEDATKLCVDKGATDLQACIDYKTGVTATYKAKPKS